MQGKRLGEEFSVCHDPVDVSWGLEKVSISICVAISESVLPPKFQYVLESRIYDKAHVNTTLSRLGDEDFCQNCAKDCLATSLPCICIWETGGVFAYRGGGLFSDSYLREVSTSSKLKCGFFFIFF
jgi:hypothetical protein